MVSEKMKLVMQTYARMDETYSTQWGNQSLDFNDDKIYQKIADWIYLPGGSIHVDLGFGIGILLAYLYKMYPKSVFFGVDANPSMFELASRFMIANKVPFMLNLGVSIKCIDRVYGSYSCLYELPDGAKLIDYFAMDKVHFIGDIFSRMTVMDTLLDGRKVDSVSFCFPGSSHRILHEEPFSFLPTEVEKEALGSVDNILEAVQICRTRKAMEFVRGDALRWIARNLQVGGKFYYVDRVNICEENEEMYEKFLKDPAYILFSLGHYWDVKKVEIFDASHSAQGMNLLTESRNDESMSISMFNNITVPAFFVEYERNKTLYQE